MEAPHHRFVDWFYNLKSIQSTLHLYTTTVHTMHYQNSELNKGLALLAEWLFLLCRCPSYRSIMSHVYGTLITVKVQFSESPVSDDGLV